MGETTTHGHVNNRAIASESLEKQWHVQCGVALPAELPDPCLLLYAVLFFELVNDLKDVFVFWHARREVESNGMLIPESGFDYLLH